MNSYSIFPVVNFGAIVLLFIANIYFSEVVTLERKYEKFLFNEHIELKTKMDKLKDESEEFKEKTMNDIFLSHRLYEFKRLGCTILDGTEISKDGYCTSILIVCIVVVFFAVYKLYIYSTKAMLLHQYIVFLLPVAILFTCIVENIGRYKRCNKKIKEFIIKEGWAEQWGR